MLPSPKWIAGWHIGGAPLAYLMVLASAELAFRRAASAGDPEVADRAQRVLDTLTR
jgi:hypothetical protein